MKQSVSTCKKKEEGKKGRGKTIPPLSGSIITGSGIDIVSIGRMRKLIEKWGEGFTSRIFTAGERLYCSSKRNCYSHYGARFAAKEAFLKALGREKKGRIKWTDIKVLNTKGGIPRIHAKGEARRILEKMGIVRIISSLSHDEDYACASVILQGSHNGKVT